LLQEKQNWVAHALVLSIKGLHSSARNVK